MDRSAVSWRGLEVSKEDPRDPDFKGFWTALCHLAQRDRVARAYQTRIVDLAQATASHIADIIREYEDSK
jgi:hypothetical protein